MSASTKYEKKPLIEPQLVICEEREQLLSYEEVKELVGGNVETLMLRTGDVLLVNEDGLRLRLPKNNKATEILKYNKNVSDENGRSVLPLTLSFHHLTTMGMGSDKIVGNAVLVRKKLAHLMFSDEENTNE